MAMKLRDQPVKTITLQKDKPEYVFQLFERINGMNGYKWINDKELHEFSQGIRLPFLVTLATHVT